MLRLIIRWAIIAFAFWVAINFVPGITPQTGGWLGIVILALIFGLLNALVKPVLSLLTCPVIVLTLGLALLLINTLIFWLTGWVGQQFGVGFTVDSFWAAFLGALVVSVVSFVLNQFVSDRPRPRRRDR
jgi:putative membrane protein